MLKQVTTYDENGIVIDNYLIDSDTGHEYHDDNMLSFEEQYAEDIKNGPVHIIFID